MKYTIRIIAVSLLIFLSFSGSVLAQRKVSLIGKVTDADTHKALVRVSVYNISRGTGTMTDSLGKYKIPAFDFDRIVFSYLGYSNDTIQVNALYKRQIINIDLQQNKFSIRPVEIIGDRPDYARDSVQRRKWFASALNQDKVNGWGAVAHPISALYDALSGRQKSLWRFQKDYKAYEQQKYVESRVHPKQIEDLFHLKGDSLKAFLLWYDPAYNFIRDATDYNLLLDIKAAVKRFRKVYEMKPNMDFDNQNVR